jgi:hypothetical protein
MARYVFFSFHYQRDIVRVNQIRNLPEIVDKAAAGFKDASLWEDAKKKSDDAIKNLIDDGLKGTTVSVVCIGYQTAGRKFINYEIQKSIDRGNGILGVKIHHLKNFAGESDPDYQIAGEVENRPETAYNSPTRPATRSQAFPAAYKAAQALLAALSRPRRLRRQGA